MPFNLRLPLFQSRRAARLSAAVLATGLLVSTVADAAHATCGDCLQADWQLSSVSWGAGPVLVSLIQSARREGPVRGEFAGFAVAAPRPLPSPPAGFRPAVEVFRGFSPPTRTGEPMPGLAGQDDRPVLRPAAYVPLAAKETPNAR